MSTTIRQWSLGPQSSTSFDRTNADRIGQGLRYEHEVELPCGSSWRLPTVVKRRDTATIDWKLLWPRLGLSAVWRRRSYTSKSECFVRARTRCRKIAFQYVLPYSP